MESLPPPPTLPPPSCPPRPPLPSTSTSSTIHSCNSACKMVPCETAHPPSTIPSIQPNLLFLPNELGPPRTAWEHLLDKFPAHYPHRVRKHLRNHHILGFKWLSTAPNRSKPPLRTSIPSRLADQPVYHLSSRISRSTHRRANSGCKQRRHPPSRPQCRLSARRHHPPNPSMGVESTPLKTEDKGIHKGYRLEVVQASRLVLQMGRTTAILLQPSILRMLRHSSSSNDYTKCGYGKCRPPTLPSIESQPA